MQVRERGEGHSGNDKVKEPLGRSGDGDVEGAQAGGRNFGDVDPAARAPAELEEAVDKIVLIRNDTFFLSMSGKATRTYTT